MILNYRNFTQYGLSDFISRSASLDDAAENDAAFLKSHSISSIIDLRRHSRKWSYSFLSEHGFKVFNYGLSIHIFFDNDDENNMSDEYLSIALQRETVQKIIKCIADSEGNVLLFCSWGKDRTGVIIAIIMMIAGIDITTIASDYCKSDGITSAFICDDRITDYAKQANSKYITDFCRKLISKYGTIENYCKFLGISDSDIVSIKRKVNNIG